MKNYDLDLDRFWESMVKILDSKGTTVGSGFIIHPDGYIITCHHVIYPLALLKVEHCGQEYQAEWCNEYSNPEVDIAILKIDVKDAKPIPITIPQHQAVAVMVYGFPHNQETKGFPKGFDVYGTLSQSPPIETRFTYNRISEVEQLAPWNKKPKRGSTFWAYRIDQKVDYGISGGPVIDLKSGRAMGIIQCKGNQKSYVISWKNITENLTRLGINPEQAIGSFEFEASYSSFGGIVKFQGYFLVQGAEKSRVDSFEIKKYIEEHLKVELINFLDSSPLFQQAKEEDDWVRAQRLKDIEHQKDLISRLNMRKESLERAIINLSDINPVQADSYKMPLEECKANIKERETKLKQLQEKDNNTDLAVLLSNSNDLFQLERFSNDWAKKAISSEFGLEISISNLTMTIAHIEKSKSSTYQNKTNVLTKLNTIIDNMNIKSNKLPDIFKEDEKNRILKDIEIYQKEYDGLTEDIETVMSNLEIAQTNLTRRKFRTQIEQLEKERQPVEDKLKKLKAKLAALD